MKRKFWSLTCGVALASLLGSVSPASAADPKGFKPTISANPAVVSLEATYQLIDAAPDTAVTKISPPAMVP